MSDPIVTGCGETIFGPNACLNPIVYYSEEVTVNCPSGSVNGPFISPAGKFTSTVSQEISDALAQSYAQSLADVGCQSVVSNFVLEFLGPVDDDVRVRVNGSVPVQPLEPSIFYWDYILHDWSIYWTSTGIPSPIPSGPTTFKATSLDRKWNVLWYAGSSYLTQNFIKLKYSGPLYVGDVISIHTIDGWQGQYLLAPWQATITYYDGTTHIISGGSTFTGTSVNVPSPPRVNPASAPPYNNINNLAAYLGLPDYRSQAYPNSGPFFSDYYANGSFTIPSL